MLDDTSRGVLAVGCSSPEAFDADETAVLVELGRSLTAHAERIAAEGALATQRELLRAVFDCASYGIYYATADGTVLLTNDAFLRLAGMPRSQLLGRCYLELTSPGQREPEREAVEQVLRSGLPSEYDKELTRGDGFGIPVRLSVAPVRDRSGLVVGTVAIVRDIVAEKEAAAALRESQDRYRAAFRNNPAAIFVVDAAGSVVDANPAAAAMTGASREGLLRHALAEFVPPDQLAAIREALEGLQREGAVRVPQLRFAGPGGVVVETDLYGTTLGGELWQVLARDVTERVQAEAKLLALNEILEEKVAARTRELEHAAAALAHAGRMKDQFLASMSHELRTPLNAVLGLADALLEGVYGGLDEQQRQILVTMRDSGKHLLALINDILDLSKIEAGRLELDIRTISVTEVCQTSLRMIRPLALAKRIGTWMRIDPEFPIVVADERRLKQVLVNLLSNAVKFTPAGGQAGIEAWCNPTEVYFSVCDTGIGIASPNLRRVFEPFTQIDSSLSRQHEGTGLGLALVRRLVDLHGGRVEVDSEPGKGSRFTIVLPRMPPPERDSIPPMEVR
jgi:PAS domain S-box-containing protein